MPTLDGELYGVAPQEPEEPPEPRAMTAAERQRKRREKIKAEREAENTAHCTEKEKGAP